MLPKKAKKIDSGENKTAPPPTLNETPSVDKITSLLKSKKKNS